MKAKIRKTGEIVDIVCHNHCSTIRSHQDYVSYIDSKGIEHDRESLNYYWDFEPIETNNSEHWQDIRIQAAIAAMQGIISCSIHYLKDTIAKLAVEQADALIEALKKK